MIAIKLESSSIKKTASSLTGNVKVFLLSIWRSRTEGRKAMAG